MAYAIGEIIYGVDLTSPSYSDDPHEAVRDELCELEEAQRHVETAYSGNGDTPMWLGVMLGSIDECNAVDGQWLIDQLTVTPETQAAYQALLDALEADDEVSDELKRHIKGLTPKSQILWGSS